MPPGHDYGGALRPSANFSYGDLGFLFGVGMTIGKAAGATNGVAAGPGGRRRHG